MESISEVHLPQNRIHSSILPLNFVMDNLGSFAAEDDLPSLVALVGDDEDTTWKARVVDYIRRHATTGHFFKRRDSTLWVLDGTRNQEMFLTVF